MKPDDIVHLHSLSAPTLSPDGGRAVFALTRPDLEEDAYLGSLWSVPTDGSAPPARLTRGTRDSGPVFSPDGRWIAFLRSDENKRPQIHVLPADGGEPWQTTFHPLGAGAPRWSPDSSRIAYTARIPEPDRYVDVEPGKEPPRRITRLKYRMDGLGFTNDRRSHVFVSAPVDPSGEAGEPVQVTRGDFDHQAVSWRPDGGELVFSADRHATRDTDLVTDLWACAPEEGAEPRRVTAGTLDAGESDFSEDGATVYFRGDELGPGLDDFVGQTTALWSVPADASAAPVRLTPAHDPRMAGGPKATSRGLLGLAENRGAVDLVLVPFGGGEPETVIGGRTQVQSFDSVGGVTVAVVADARGSGELVLVTDTGTRALTEFTGALEPLPTTELTAHTDDGHPVHGWVAVPEGEGPHPVVLMIHGGPFAQYGHQFFDETQVYAAAGYAVVLCNPRGSSGYGHEHGRAVIGSVGRTTATDVLAFLDEALRDQRLDRSRVGVMGGSHGGFMATWIAAHHGDRFRAAISERAVNAIESFHGSSDIGAFFPEPLYGPPETWAEESPLTHADQIDVPFLIIHSEEDWRCPLEQAQRLFVALKRRGHETEMLLFPGEGHELSRSGLPSHRVARFEAVLDWWQRHL
ncbi:dipeptidyl aminopeptidase/acylaminoacyl peptidase [Nocardiopsis arvandica]|uniref:Dipeptidyl aminopeptidase/acylaminoacyl peptidase n=1 Tax=Nocardiopsis sinuspersici TaxID=501010 RepID=A0A7Z0BN09_9ACTN|nr:S9 family peptidase [Nocardiopsis sinuspersici]NYH55009.1 dipeptidyl aminopeptidase/acylaminoacyl peptidase [Nocardiopsis sinuspersici]